MGKPSKPKPRIAYNVS